MCGDDVIDQLAFLAGCFKHKLINDEVTPDGWIIPDESLRKFAELIVRKCVGLCRQEQEDYLLVGSDYCDNKAEGFEEAAELIKEHFGFKEPKGWVCPKCGVDRTKTVCPQGHTAAVEGKCPMIGVAQ